MKYNKYISTTLPYANSIPHIGHSLEFIQADALKKYFTGRGEKVFFNIGVDEHGLKVFEKAKELNVDVNDYLDSLALKWQEFCDLFEIKADNFYRTTDTKHCVLVQEFWQMCLERGDLYKKTYSGKYCTGCESFKTDIELVDGKCADHNTVPTLIEEENWFFKISKYKALTYGWLQANKDFLTPQAKTAELENIILQAEDISVSRLKKNVPWGIEVPNDPDQVIYVWFEALLNYIFAVDNYEEQHFIQLCGPDNLRFQGSLFQTILASANLPHTKKLLVHGTVLDSDGKKMSKSLGNVIDPIDQLNKYGLDAVRYYTLAGLTTYGNSSWSEQDLVTLYNADLCDNFGNLLARVLHLVDIHKISISDDLIDSHFKTKANIYILHAETLWEGYEIQQAIKQVGALLRFGNKYITDSKPWEKGADDQTIINNLYYVLNEANELYAPVLSSTTYSAVKTALQQKQKAIIFPKKQLFLADNQ